MSNATVSEPFRCPGCGVRRPTPEALEQHLRLRPGCLAAAEVALMKAGLPLDTALAKPSHYRPRQPRAESAPPALHGRAERRARRLWCTPIEIWTGLAVLLAALSVVPCVYELGRATGRRQAAADAAADGYASAQLRVQLDDAQWRLSVAEREAAMWRAAAARADAFTRTDGRAVR